MRISDWSSDVCSSDLPSTQAVSAKRAEIARGDQRVPPPLALLFSMAEGSVKTLDAGNDQGYFIVKLDSIQRGDAGKQPEIVDAVKQQMSRVVGNEYVEQFARADRSEEHTSELHSLMRISYAVFCLQKNNEH